MLDGDPGAVMSRGAGAKSHKGGFSGEIWPIHEEDPIGDWALEGGGRARVGGLIREEDPARDRALVGHRGLSLQQGDLVGRRSSMGGFGRASVIDEASQ